MGTADGARRYRPGVWGLVEVTAANATANAITTESVLWFMADPTLQYARRLTVPPHAVLRTTCPIRVPDTVPITANSLEAFTVAGNVPGAAPAPASTLVEVMRASQLMAIDRERPTVAMIGDLDANTRAVSDRPYHAGPMFNRGAPDDLAYEMVLAAKRARGLSRSMSILHIEHLPPDPATLDAVDVIVLCSDRVVADPGSIALLRDWVLGGGNLWIMLDEVRSETVAAVLGDAYATAEVDRVRLTQVNVRHVDDPADVPSGSVLELEEPVTLVRVIPAGATVMATLDGWPAAFWQPIGAGRVYVTTASPAAWMRPGTPRDPRPHNEQDDTAFFPREPLVTFAQACLLPSQVPGVVAGVAQPLLAEQIGYRIIDRGLVAAWLGGFCTVLLVGILWIGRQGRPTRLLWLAPVAAGLVTVVFVVLGATSKRVVPPTVASLTQVLLEPGVGTGHVTGHLAMYNQHSCSEYLGADRGGMFFPDMQALTGLRRRLLWTDEGTWHWDALELPAGVRVAPVTQSLHLPRTVDCRAQFGPDGLRGTLVGLPWTRLEDAIIAAPRQPAMAASVDAAGVLTARAGDVLPPGEFVTGVLVRDEQRQRRSILQQLLGAVPEHSVSLRPVVLAWADATELGFRFPQTHARHATLVSLPLRLEHTAPGTSVIIPPTFITYRAIADAAGGQPSVFGNLTRQWGETDIAATEWLRFQLPSTVLPLRVSRATLAIIVRAPSRVLQVLAFRHGEPQVIQEWKHPIGSFTAVLEDAELLAVDATGGLQLAIRVSEDSVADPQDPMRQASWKIDSLQLEIAGTVLGDRHE
jgi:hypothetical protein